MANANSNIAKRRQELLEQMGDDWIIAVAYYRMSTDEQKESIAAQRLLVEQYAADHGFRLVGEYLNEMEAVK